MPTALVFAALISSGFGPTTSGLQLSVTVDARGASATFSIRNTTSRAITYAERYSCSGTSHFSISTGPTRAKLDIHFHFEPKARGLTTKLTTRCTVNVPIDMRTIQPGKTASLRIPFATAGALHVPRNKLLRANALLVLEGRTSFSHLHSALARR